MIVVVTDEAEADLERIGDHIAVDNSRRAATFVRELREKCATLALAPRGYPLVPRHEHAGIRRRPYGGYLIFYRIGTDVIEVVHVLHGAQDYQAILCPEG
jgi:toxin ParE1/3/4